MTTLLNVSMIIFEDMSQEEIQRINFRVMKKFQKFNRENDTLISIK